MFQNLEIRRSFRKQPTPEEWLLWEELRNNKLRYKFRRQRSIGVYIADFYCPKYKLVVEIDGEFHKSKEMKVKDNSRDEYMKSLGICVIRFWGGQVRNDMDAVLEIVRTNLHPHP